MTSRGQCPRGASPPPSGNPVFAPDGYITTTVLALSTISTNRRESSRHLHGLDWT